MEVTSFENQLNKILLKPRFSIESANTKDEILNAFKATSESATASLNVKVVDNHVVIDIVKTDEHFWSPQLQLEIEGKEDGTSIIKGLFGPKPKLWTLFMFIHFGVALAFAVFATMLYTDWSLEKDLKLSLMLTIAMPVLWILFYLFGRWGKRKGYKQMVKLYRFMEEKLT